MVKILITPRNCTHRLCTHRLCTHRHHLTTLAQMPNELSTQQRSAFGRQLRTLRKAAALTQEGLAEASGVHVSYLAQVERGLRNVSLDQINKLARGLKCSPAQFFEEDPPSGP